MLISLLVTIHRDITWHSIELTEAIVMISTAVKSRKNIDFNQKKQGEIVLTCVFRLVFENVKK